MSRNIRFQQQPKREAAIPMNERIVNPTVRLIGADGQQVGVVATRDALTQARAAGLDLIIISPGDVPVCRILDAGKYLFEKKRQEREAARRQRELVTETKEIQLRPVTDDHDLLVKARKATEFLADGHKVKVAVRFKGRENTHRDVGRQIVVEFLAAVGEHKIDKPLMEGGRELVLIVAPVRSRADLLRERDSEKA